MFAIRIRFKTPVNLDLRADLISWKYAGQRFVFPFQKLAGGWEVLPDQFWQDNEIKGNRSKKVQ